MKSCRRTGRGCRPSHPAGEKEALYRECTPAPGAAAGFDAITASAAGIKLAVARPRRRKTSTSRSTAWTCASEFDAIAGAADVARGKPHPDVFLLAPSGRRPADSIVFEDAPLGVEAAPRRHARRGADHHPAG
jgi:beta-phosphoglucomutase-like phosphatase (HAD superfamily)